MLKLLFSLLAFAAIGLTIYYGIFYQSPISGATYHHTYTWLSLGAAIIFSGLLYALMVNRNKTLKSMSLK